MKPALQALRAWPRQRWANLPTPLRRASRLEGALGADPLYLKMDAETGFALGGNKVRKLELELAPDRLAGVTHLLTAGGPQSNHARVTAAAAARLGLGCTLVVNGPAPDRPTGNARLHRLFGAEIVTVEDREQRTEGLERVARTISAEGGHPLVIPIGASTGLGCLGYALAIDELLAQLDRLEDDCSSTLLVTSSSSGGTLAGLLLGLALHRRDDVSVLAVSADAPAEELQATAEELAREGAALLAGTGATRADDVTTADTAEATDDLARRIDSVSVEVTDEQVGGGYGIPTPASEAAIRTFATLEGVVLDPTYTAKAAAELVARAEAGRIGAGCRGVFLHTGGAPGLLA